MLSPGVLLGGGLLSQTLGANWCIHSKLIEVMTADLG